MSGEITFYKADQLNDFEVIHDSLIWDFEKELLESYSSYQREWTLPCFPVEVFTDGMEFFDYFMECYYYIHRSRMRWNFDETRWDNFTEEEYGHFEEERMGDTESFVRDVLKVFDAHQLFHIMTETIWGHEGLTEIQTSIGHSPLQEVW